ncbi:hypothetical protein [Paludisphaera borealis]|uniref:Putative MFS-type transporter YhjX n=1 Tax=Paludisphaera borealis TaxID=1387353 RepID=A0A1U7CRU4_9BACT|nr:hypothetical protein [Paludisphaera borealis]APW61667.1 putative MFS-type transporter YhjX [Paludisphaera borealis]
MASCDCCGTRILFGGVKLDDLRFCNAKCAEQGYWIQRGDAIPEGEVQERLRSLHQGQCPRCAGPGPVDVHTSHRVYSALAFTAWSSHPEICCRSCGRWKQLKHGAFSLALGWWGFPFGFLLTPVQLTRNFTGLVGLSGPKDDAPSPTFRRAVQVAMAKQRAGG